MGIGVKLKREKVATLPHPPQASKHNPALRAACFKELIWARYTRRR